MPSLAATTPKPSPKPTPVVIHLPNTPLHVEVVVEVNKKGQVVRVKSAKPSKVRSFNIQTYGNALQMWIRKPDGSAEVGLYRVTYDYNPKNQQVTRRVALVSLGGNWGNSARRRRRHDRFGEEAGSGRAEARAAATRADQQASVAQRDPRQTDAEADAGRNAAGRNAPAVA